MLATEIADHARKHGIGERLKDLSRKIPTGYGYKVECSVEVEDLYEYTGGRNRLNRPKKLYAVPQ
jgi:hypothetical protein